MNVRPKYIILIIALVLVAVIIKKTAIKAPNQYGKIISSKGYINNFVIVNAATTLARGNRGFITISGQKGNKYILKSTFKRGKNTYDVTKVNTADGNGMTTFLWDVDKESVPGTYPITITDGKKTYNLVHTVLN